MIEMTAEDVNDLDAVVHELGIEDSHTTPAEAVRELKAEIERLRLQKRPVAFRVKATVGWLLFENEEEANRQAERAGGKIQGLYVRDGT